MYRAANKVAYFSLFIHAHTRPFSAVEWTIRIIPHTAGELPGAILASETTPSCFLGTKEQ